MVDNKENKENSSMLVKVNLGCGPSGIDGWVNYDWGILPFISKIPFLQRLIFSFRLLPSFYSAKWPKLELVNIKNKLPLKDNSVDYIYCSHVLEHFEPWEALDILKECKRVMKTESVLRIVTPDIRKMVNIYLNSGGNTRAAKILCNMWWGFDKDKQPANFLGKISRSFTREHLWNYDEEEMEALMRSAGYEHLTWVSIGTGEVPDIDKLDSLSVKNTSLYVEVKKI